MEILHNRQEEFLEPQQIFPLVLFTQILNLRVAKITKIATAGRESRFCLSNNNSCLGFGSLDPHFLFHSTRVPPFRIYFRLSLSLVKHRETIQSLAKTTTTQQLQLKGGLDFRLKRNCW